MTSDEARQILSDIFTAKQTQNASLIANNQKEIDAWALVQDLFDNNVQAYIDSGVQAGVQAAVDAAAQANQIAG